MTSSGREYHGVMAVTIYGVVAVSLMMAMHALARRDRRFTIGLAAGCPLSSAYGLLSSAWPLGAWPPGIVELVWSEVALRRSQTGPAA